MEIKEITNGEMCPVVIDATGNLNAINNGFKFLAHGGRYILIGLQKEKIHFNHPEFHKREVTLMSSRNATEEDFNHVLDSIKTGKVNPEKYITHRVAFSKVKEEFPKWLHPGSSVIKVIIEMEG
jgi:2-desacetyl-2-hydroxyethyl bacteriochlorophyllide A dehydrogenase